MIEAVTLITGGAGGIGAATARRLLAEGYRVAVTGRDEGRLARFAAEVDAGPALLTIAGDAADQADVEAAVAATLKEYGRLDGVVANAGFSTHDNFVDGDPELLREGVERAHRRLHLPGLDLGDRARRQLESPRKLAKTDPAGKSNRAKARSECCWDVA